MAYSNLTRNLRDGQLTVNDGTGTPKSVTLILDEGNLRWTETDNTIEVKDRGALDHTRPGDQNSCEMSFTTKWTQLLQGSLSAGDGYVLYEMVNDSGGSFISTSAAGEQYTLEYVFVVNSPDGVTAKGEIITFNKVYKKTLVCGEGNEYNTVEFSGVDFETKPVITRDS